MAPKHLADCIRNGYVLTRWNEHGRTDKDKRELGIRTGELLVKLIQRCLLIHVTDS